MIEDEARRAAIRAAVRADEGDGQSCPWCNEAQHKMDFPLAVAVHDYPCEHCGKPIKVTVAPRASWTLTLRKAPLTPTEQGVSE